MKIYILCYLNNENCIITEGVYLDYSKCKKDAEQLQIDKPYNRYGVQKFEVIE